MLTTTTLYNRFARIVATLGPSSSSEADIRRLILAGLDVARLNFSHGTHAEHAQRISLLRQLSNELGKPITILQDLQGPKMRIGTIPEGTINLTAGQMVTLASVDESLVTGTQDSPLIPCDVPEFSRIVQKGSHILLDDGHLEMEVVTVQDGRVSARVLLGGPLSSHKGVNLPGAQLTIPGFTEKDREDLAFGLEQKVDAVAVSFVRTAEDILTVRQAIKDIAPGQADTPIIAKLERPEALENLEAILQVTDGVMVARGDLGVEMSPASVPIAQKKIIESANRHSKVVITATQMLDSMINNPRPTRAEASDVANAIFDGTDAVMLSGETASGKYPVESILMMDSIIKEAESHFNEWGHKNLKAEESTEDDAVSITRAARELAHDRNVAAIAVFTQTGHTALLMAKARPRVPVLALTPEPRAYHKLGLYWGVIPFMVPYASTMEALIAQVEKTIAESTSLKPGQQVVVISGFPVGKFRLPNFALLHTIGSEF
jgi:pyruvate kinase